MEDASEERWWEDYSNVVTLISAMADNPIYDKEDLAYAVEKPWKFGDVWDEVCNDVDR